MNYAEVKPWQMEPVAKVNQVEGCFVKGEKYKEWMSAACLVMAERYRCNPGSHTGVSSAQKTHLSWKEGNAASSLELLHIILPPQFSSPSRKIAPDRCTEG